jgi:hypothetical protein
MYDDAGKREWTHADLRAAFDQLSEKVEEWHGFPVPLPGYPVTLHERHPLRDFYEIANVQGGDDREIECSDDDVDETESIRNCWYSRKLNATIYVVQNKKRGIHALKQLHSPDRTMERLSLWLVTLGASDAWDNDAEANALDKLVGLVDERQMRHYLLTGSFLESSERSGLTYMFRKLRPTIVLSPHNPLHDSMQCIAVLCMHPLGYYKQTWAGCMVPTDDVIAHLLHMRGDEARYWGEANQHRPWMPEAGI